MKRQSNNIQLKFHLTVLLILAAIVTDLGAVEKYSFQHISINEGLKNSRVISTLQDHMGYMWFATHNGLEKFNGSEIQHYSLAYDTTFYAQDNIVNCIEKSDDFDILCGTKGGNLYYYNRRLNTFTSLLTDNISDELFNIICLHADDGKGVWIGTSSTLYFYDKKTNKNVRVYPIENGVTGFEDGHDNTLWLATQKGLVLLNKKNFTPVKIQHNNLETKSLEQKDIMAIHAIDDHTLAACTRNSEVFIIEYEQNTLKLINYKQFTIDDKLYPIRDFEQTPDGDYVIAIDGAGIIITDEKLNIKSVYRSDDDNLNSLSSNGVYDLYYSADKILWVATYGGGINFYDPNKKPFKTVKHIPYIANSLRNNTVNSIIEDNFEKVWFGTKKGISIYNEKTAQWKHIPKLSNTKLDPIQVMQMDKDMHGNIWIATYGNGLIKINPETYAWEHFTKNKDGYYQTETNHLYHVITDDKDRIWTGGIWGSVSVIDPKLKQTQRVNISNVRSFYNDKNQVMVGTLFGLFLVDTHSLEVTRPKHNVLIESRIITIGKHPVKDIIYFGTDLKGIIAWDRTHNTIQHFTKDQGLPANYIRAIVWDKENKMWVSTTGGLSSFDKDNNYISTYLPIDGLASTEFAENAVCRLNSGRIIFGGLSGVTHFYPQQITTSDQVTSPILTGIKLSGEELKIQPDGPLTENINTQEGIHLKYNENSINISFSAIGFSTPNKIQYKWMLEGFENKWNNTPGIKEAIYSKLPPGNFVFKVMCTNDDNIWQKEVKEFAVYIDKPYWKKPLAFVVYMIILGGIIMLILHYSHTILQEKHFEEKQQFFISIAHDLRTPLSLIKLPIEKMIEGDSGNNIETKNLNLVKRNIDRLTNLVNQLLDFQKADLHKMKLQVEESEIISFIKERIELFIPLANEKQIALEFDYPEQEVNLWFDKGKMEKIMYNLLSNAIKYTPEGGSIKLSTKIDKKRFYVTVSDTGEGIPKNQQKNIFQRYYRATNAINSREVGSGVGLVLTKQLIELHHGKIDFKSELNKGTSFWFYIPTGKLHYTEDNLKSETTSKTEVKPITQISSDIDVDINKEENKGPKLLLVEDNPELLESLAHEFSSDYQVFTAQNGEEGLQLTKSEMPDIVVSDVMMPVMNGHQLCLKIKGDLSICHIPIVLLTALDSVDYKREGLEHGADAYVEKPFDLKMLRAQISNLLKNRSMLKQKFLIPSSGVADSSPTNNDQLFLEKIQNHVIQNLDSDELSVESTAKELGMSRPVLYRKIKALTDLSPQQFVMNIKLKEAARIMKEENKNISETAFMVGFSDPKYFSQTFKKHFGMTPTQYLKQEGSN
ncbi:response regulator [Labilibacter sediminis]|nr:response regulator [Labilibacter sediminis]